MPRIFSTPRKYSLPPPGQTTVGPPIDSSNIFTIPISTEYCTASASGVTPVVTCDASIMTRIRLTSAQLGVPGEAQDHRHQYSRCGDRDTALRGGAEFGWLHQHDFYRLPFESVYASPGIGCRGARQFSARAGATLAVNGGYYGGTNPPDREACF